MALDLATVETAIETIAEGGQSFTIDGITYTQANLGQLVALRSQLQSDENREDGTRPTFRAFGFGSMAY